MSKKSSNGALPYPKVVKCKVCREEFMAVSRKHTCSDYCGEIQADTLLDPAKRKYRKCETCQTYFENFTANQKYCDSWCRDNRDRK